MIMTTGQRFVGWQQLRQDLIRGVLAVAETMIDGGRTETAIHGINMEF
jgi:hypothetical protein